MATSIAPLIKQRYFSANGAPLAGGKLYTYQAGTTTPQATYTDSGALTPNANPVVLDANGEANMWLDQNLSYKFVLKDSSDVVQWTVDSVIGVLTDDAVATGSLQDGAVTAAKLASNAVTTVKILDANVTRAKLAVGAVAMVNHAAKTGNYTVTTSDDFLEADASSGAFTFTLPAAASGNKGMTVDFLRTDQTLGNLITITDGTLTKKLATQGEMIKCRSNGTAWKIITRYIPCQFVAYTPTITGFGAQSSVAFLWRRIGDSMEIRGQFTSGIPTTVAASVTIPGSLTTSTTGAGIVDGGKYLNQNIAGRTAKGGAILWNNNQNTFNFGALETFGAASSTTPLSAKNADDVAANTDIIGLDALIPITGWEG